MNIDELIFNPPTSSSKPSQKLEENFLYSWGKNKDGELSLGHTKSVTTPKIVRGIKNKSIVFISTGRQHTAAISSDGVLFVCGSSLHGKLGIDDLTMTCLNKFHLVPALQGIKVKQVACGDYHTLCLTQNGDVYAWGGTLHKKLGQKGGKPAQVSSLCNKKVVSVGCGDFHSAALTEKGELFTWGGGGSHFNRGQLGHGHLKDVESPEMVQFFKGKFVKKFSCGGYHTMALSMDDQLYGWGSGNYGECGFGEFVDASLPRKVTINYNQKGLMLSDASNNNIVSISCGGHHSLILTSFGFVYSCGYGSHGQLGLKSTVNQNEPQLIFSLTNKHVIQIAAGWNHSLVLTDKLDLYSTGYGSSGQLGLGDDESKIVFTHVASLGGKNIDKIFAGGNHSWVFLDDQNPNNNNYVPPSPLKEVDEISVTQLKPEELKEDVQPNPIGIEIHFNELDMCHRFIKFKIEDYYSESIQFRIEEYINELKEIDQLFTIKLNNLKKDEEISIEVEEDSKSPNFFKHLSVPKSYTLMMVCDTKYNLMEDEKEESDIVKNRLIETCIGEKCFLTEDEIERNKRERNFGLWALFFLKKFRSVCASVFFMELRPNSFM